MFTLGALEDHLFPCAFKLLEAAHIPSWRHPSIFKASNGQRGLSRDAVSGSNSSASFFPAQDLGLHRVHPYNTRLFSCLKISLLANLIPSAILIRSCR